MANKSNYFPRRSSHFKNYKVILSGRGSQEVSVVVERFEEGPPKKIYTASNGDTKGEIVTLYKNGTIKSREKLK